MPLYDVHCPACGLEEDDVCVSLADWKPEGIPCSACTGMAKRKLYPIASPGPCDDKPLVVEQIGRTFTSQKQVDAYEKASGNCLVAPNDTSFTRNHDMAHEKADAKARKAGHSDFRARQKTMKKTVKA
jgi:hypothetical protein